jgi:hypothetical protein
MRGRGPSPTKWDTKGLAFVGACFGWLLVFAHEVYNIVVSLLGCHHDIDPFAHFKVHPFAHIAIELALAGLAGALLFASAAETRNRFVRAP